MHDKFGLQGSLIWLAIPGGTEKMSLGRWHCKIYQSATLYLNISQSCNCWISIGSSMPSVSPLLGATTFYCILFTDNHLIIWNCGVRIQDLLKIEQESLRPKTRLSEPNHFSPPLWPLALCCAVTFHLNRFNCLPADLSLFLPLLPCLPSVVHSAARVAHLKCTSDHISPLFRILQQVFHFTTNAI